MPAGLGDKWRCRRGWEIGGEMGRCWGKVCDAAVVTTFWDPGALLGDNWEMGRWGERWECGAVWGVMCYAGERGFREIGRRWKERDRGR
jgi:hypothetical protein